MYLKSKVQTRAVPSSTSWIILLQISEAGFGTAGGTAGGLWYSRTSIATFIPLKQYPLPLRK